MNDIALLVMAAGMGSRYGGLKQLDSVGPCGETIIDYSIYDAIDVGFKKVVFIIRREFETQFRQKITNKYLDKINVDFVFQDLENLPNRYKCPGQRKKPWGTGHAILTAENNINSPFVVINGDDFYGRESFKVVIDYFLSKKSKSPGFCMVAYKLENTLSNYGSVTRGICTTSSNYLDSISETSGLERAESSIKSNRDMRLTGQEPVSMNFWGFTPKIFKYLNNDFKIFLDYQINDSKSEFLIPKVINNLIENKIEKVDVLKSSSNWFGVTYQADKPYVKEEIKKLIQNNIYPSPLFK